MKTVAAAIAELDAQASRRLRQGQSIEIAAGSAGTVTIGPDDVLIQRQEKEGMTVANEGDVTVAIDTRLDPALLREGWARDIVNRLQTMRKEADLQVTDRIRVRYELPAEIAAAVSQFTDYIMAETLAVDLSPASLPDVEPGDVNGVPCRFEIAREKKV